MSLQDDNEYNKLKELLKTTRGLLNASKGVNIDEIGKQIAQRQICIDALKANGGLSSNRTAAKQSLIDEIMMLDAKACRSIWERKHEVGLQMLEYKKKASGLLHYNSSLYNLASGQLIDRCK